MFITKTDLYNIGLPNQLDEITRGDDTLIVQSIEQAIENKTQRVKERKKRTRRKTFNIFLHITNAVVFFIFNSVKPSIKQKLQKWEAYKKDVEQSTQIIREIKAD